VLHSSGALLGGEADGSRELTTELGEDLAQCIDGIAGMVADDGGTQVRLSHVANGGASAVVNCPACNEVGGVETPPVYGGDAPPSAPGSQSKCRRYWTDA